MSISGPARSWSDRRPPAFSGAADDSPLDMIFSDLPTPARRAGNGAPRSSPWAPLMRAVARRNETRRAAGPTILVTRPEGERRTDARQDGRSPLIAERRI